MRNLIKRILKEESNPIDYTHQEMEDAVFDIFKDNLVVGDRKYMDGIVDVHTIGERMGDNTRWSILNFFDTNRRLKTVVLRDLKKMDIANKTFDLLGATTYRDGDEDGGQHIPRNEITNRLKLLLSDESNLKRYLNVVWDTIKRGFESESKFVKRLKNRGYNVDYSGEPGTKEDRYGGIDAKVNGKVVQVKHANQVFPLGDGKFYRVIITGGKRGSHRLPNYKEKKGLDFLAFYIESEDRFYIFKNSGYSQKQDSEKGLITFTFNSKPSRL
jgi:hypothetical protein